MVPRLLIKASPGPETRKKPEVRNHMVESVRYLWVSSLRSHVFLRRFSRRAKRSAVEGRRESEVRVP